ncbi:MAG: hypothetical protein LIP77_04985 [Planctomycetes bacterium]|nr:hypothetical protein [Planctomycetota bacterium]
MNQFPPTVSSPATIADRYGGDAFRSGGVWERGRPPSPAAQGAAPAWRAAGRAGADYAEKRLLQAVATYSHHDTLAQGYARLQDALAALSPNRPDGAIPWSDDAAGTVAVQAEAFRQLLPEVEKEIAAVVDRIADHLAAVENARPEGRRQAMRDLAVWIDADAAFADGLPEHLTWHGRALTDAQVAAFVAAGDGGHRDEAGNGAAHHPAGGRLAALLELRDRILPAWVAAVTEAAGAPEPDGPAGSGDHTADPLHAIAVRLDETADRVKADRDLAGDILELAAREREAWAAEDEQRATGRLLGTRRAFTTAIKTASSLAALYRTLARES